MDELCPGNVPPTGFWFVTRDPHSWFDCFRPRHVTPDGLSSKVERTSHRVSLVESHAGGLIGAHVDTPAPTMRNPMLVMYEVSSAPVPGSYLVTFVVRLG